MTKRNMTKIGKNNKAKENNSRAIMKRTTNVAAVNKGATVRKTPWQSISATKDGIRVRNYEKMGAAAVGTNSALGYMHFNPCDNVLFPWMSAIARSYSKYKVHKLRYHYVPTVSTAQGGLLSAGWFGDWKDAATFAASAGGDALLSGGAEFYSGPVFQPAVVFELDKAKLHQNVPWYLTNITPSGVGVPGTFAYTWFAWGITSGSPGCFYVEYDVEFSQPVVGNISANRNSDSDEKNYYPYPAQPWPPLPEPSYLRPVPACADFSKLHPDDGAEIL